VLSISNAREEGNLYEGGGRIRTTEAVKK